MLPWIDAIIGRVLSGKEDVEATPENLAQLTTDLAIEAVEEFAWQPYLAVMVHHENYKKILFVMHEPRGEQ